MGYIEGHKKSGFKVGDTVKIIRKAQSQEDGWGSIWNNSMDHLIGTYVKIKENFNNTWGFQIKTSSGINWNVPWFVLEKVSGSDDGRFKEGDEVEIIASWAELFDIGLSKTYIKQTYPKMKGVITGCYHDTDKFFLQDEVGVPAWFRASHLCKIGGTPSPKGIISSLDEPTPSPKAQRSCSTCRDNSSNAMEGGCGECYGNYSNYIKE